MAKRLRVLTKTSWWTHLYGSETESRDLSKRFIPQVVQGVELQKSGTWFR